MLKQSQKKNRSEKEIELEIRKYLERVLDAYVIKQHGSAFTKPGIHDLTVCLNGWFITIEVKANNGVISKPQKVHGRNVEKAGGLSIYAIGDNALQYVLKVLVEKGIIEFE